MKRIQFFLLFGGILLLGNIYAQGTTYTIHNVSKGETLYSLSKKYNTSIEDIRRVNGMDENSKLTIGTKLKIPSEASAPVVATPSPPFDTTNAPTHLVLRGETLYGISKNFGVTIEQLKQWNNLNDERIHFGQELAVSSEGAAIVAKKKTGQKNGTETVSTKVETEPSQVEVEKSAIDTMQKSEPTQKSIKAEHVDVAPTKEIPTAPEYEENESKNDSYFTKAFFSVEGSKDLKSTNGEAMIFKTESGWTDKKYYILMNEAPPGSIVKITSSANGNSVFAKVLGQLEDMKLNKGLQFRISDAAANALAVTDTKFNLTVQYME